MASEADTSREPADEGQGEHHNRPTRAMTWLLAGAVVFGVTTTVAFIIAGNFFEGSYEERVARIDDHLTLWRIEWAVAMVAEALAGLGLWGLGRWFLAREQGARAAAAVLVMVGGIGAVVAGVGRFAVSLGDAKYGADAGVWIDVVAIGGTLGLLLATLALAWLSWGGLVARWACVVAVLFAGVSALTLSPSPVYLPGLTVFAAAGLWRSIGERSTT